MKHKEEVKRTLSEKSSVVSQGRILRSQTHQNGSQDSNAAGKCLGESPTQHAQHIGTRNQEKLNKYKTRSNKEYGGISDQNWQRFSKEDQECAWGWPVDKIKEETEKLKCQHTINEAASIASDKKLHKHLKEKYVYDYLDALY